MAYGMSQNGEDVDVQLKGDRLNVSGRNYIVRSATHTKKKKNSVLKSIITLLIIFLLGLIIFAAVNRALGEGEASPYKQMDRDTAIQFRTTASGPGSPVHLVGERSISLEDNIMYDTEGSWDTVSIPESNGTRMLIMFYGDAGDLYSRGISELRIGFDSDIRYAMRNLEMVLLDTEGVVSDTESVALPSDVANNYRRGEHSFEMSLGELTMGRAKNMQSGTPSIRRGILLDVEFVENPAGEEVRFNMEWSPDYYHESSFFQDILGMIVLLVTVAAGIMAYFTMTRQYDALVVEHGDGEITLFGDEKDIKDLYYRIAKVTIPKMEREEEEERGVRPGISKGADLMKAASREARTGWWCSSVRSAVPPTSITNRDS